MLLSLPPLHRLTAFKKMRSRAPGKRIELEVRRLIIAKLQRSVPKLTMI